MLVQEQPQAGLVHHVRLGERERLPDEAPQPLTQRVVEPLDVAGPPWPLPVARCCSCGSTLAYTRQKFVNSRHDL